MECKPLVPSTLTGSRSAVRSRHMECTRVHDAMPRTASGGQSSSNKRYLVHRPHSPSYSASVRYKYPCLRCCVRRFGIGAAWLLQPPPHFGAACFVVRLLEKRGWCRRRNKCVFRGVEEQHPSRRVRFAASLAVGGAWRKSFRNDKHSRRSSNCAWSVPGCWGPSVGIGHGRDENPGGVALETGTPFPSASRKIPPTFRRRIANTNTRTRWAW
jgi:hypothetical protein